MSDLKIPTGYTPGPWFHEFEEYDPDEPAAHRGWSIREASSGSFLYVATGGLGSAALLEANARLIALAPEMAVEITRLRAENDHLHEPWPPKFLEGEYDDDFEEITVPQSGKRHACSRERDEITRLRERCAQLEATTSELKPTLISQMATVSQMTADIFRLRERCARLEEALRHAVGVIEAHVPTDALGVDSHEGWPILEMYLHEMRKVITPETPSEDTPHE